MSVASLANDIDHVVDQILDYLSRTGSRLMIWHGIVTDAADPLYEVEDAGGVRQWYPRRSIVPRVGSVVRVIQVEGDRPEIDDEVSPP